MDTFRNKMLFPALLFMLVAASTAAQDANRSGGSATTVSREADALLPLDPRVRTGKLDNGLTYYIRENKRPENRAVLRLAVDAGSVLEDEDQRGLAHFLEHMAFNGTEDFNKQAIVNFMESIGMQFGPEVNAHTGYDETVYKLVIPTDDPETVDTSFRILENWAHKLSLNSDDMDTERGVVIEEWRQGRGADARMQDQYRPVLFRNSRYAERLPIGNDVNALRTFDPEAVRRFYRDWYRPDLMAVVAVGDFDAARIETIIRKYFSGIRPAAKPRPRTEYDVPSHRETLFSIVTDTEATRSSVEVIYKYDPPPEDRVLDYRRQIVEYLYNMMLNQRFEELMQREDPPFLAAQSGNFRIARTKSVYELVALVKEGAAARGLEALLTEAARADRYGFTEGELDRAKRNLMSYVEQAYNERETTESISFAEEYVDHFLDGTPSPGIEYEFELYKTFLPEITLADVNGLASTWIKDTDRMVLVRAPKKEGVQVASRNELEAIFAEVGKKTIVPYEDTAVNEPLLAKVPAPGKIAAERSIAELDVTEWTLSNGMRVILKPTTFKTDEIIFTAFSLGGTSLVPDARYVSAENAASIVDSSGLGNLTLTQLQKKLAGTNVSVTPYIDELTEGLYGDARPADLETAFQMMHLYFTSPRMDETAFRAYMERLSAEARNRLSEPEGVFQDALQRILSQNHFRRRPLSVELLSELDLKAAYDVYRARFADSGDFTFVFVGNFTPDLLKPFVLTYLASLPDLPGNEKWRDIGVDPPSGAVAETIAKGIEPKSIVSLVWTGPTDWSLRNRLLADSLQQLLDIRLRETVREGVGGTYGVSVFAQVSHFPTPEYLMQIAFYCDPGRAEELSDMVLKELESVENTLPSLENLTKVKEILKRGFEQNRRENRFWVSSLADAWFHGYDPKEILSYPARVDGLTPEDIRDTARRLIDTKKYVKVILYPETAGKN